MKLGAWVVAMALLVGACSSSKPYPAGSCHSDADCDARAGMVCWSEASSPGLSCGVGCGCACPGNPDAGTCTADSECQALGPAGICEKDSCCGAMSCQRGCADDSTCGAGFACGTDHRCAAAPCQSDADCPTDFVCSGTCARKTCTSDGDCPGYCLGGGCYDHLGSCTLPPD